MKEFLKRIFIPIWVKIQAFFVFIGNILLWIWKKIAAVFDYIKKVFSGSPEASLSRMAFFVGHAIGWTLILQTFSKYNYTSNDVAVLGILIGGVTLPYATGKVGDIISNIKATISNSK